MVTRNTAISFSRNIYEKVWLDDAHTTCTSKKIGERLYQVELVNDELIKVTRDGVSKTVLIREEHGNFVYSCKKTYIRARHCAEGLFETLAKCIHDDGTVWNSAVLYTVCDHIIDTMRPAPKRPPMTMNRERVIDALKWSLQCNGCGITLPCGWLAYAEYVSWSCDARIWNHEMRHEIVYHSDADNVSKAQFVEQAADYIMERYDDLMREVAA